MSRKPKTLLTLLLAASMLFSAVACGNGKTDEEDTNDESENVTEAETEADYPDPTYTVASKNTYGIETCACSSEKYDLGDGCYLELIIRAPYEEKWDNWVTSNGIQLKYSGACETDPELMEKYNFNDVTAVSALNHLNVTIYYTANVESFYIKSKKFYEGSSDKIQSIYLSGDEFGDDRGTVQCKADNEVEGVFTLSYGELNTRYTFRLNVNVNGTANHDDDFITSKITNIKENCIVTPLPGPQVENAEYVEVAEEDRIVVVCVGECLTASTYPDELQKILGNKYKVINCGASGSGAQIGDNIIWGPGNWSYADSDYFKNAASYNADIVIVMLGTNDAYSLSLKKPETVENYYNSLKTICEAFRAKETTEIYLCASPFRDDIEARTVNLREIVVPQQKKLAEDMGYKFLDLFSITEHDIDELGIPYLADHVHFNADGYRYLAEQIYLGFFANSEEE